MNIKYSAVITSFNAEHTIFMAVNSFLTQEITPLEVIVIDDSSNDGTWMILQELAKHESRLRIYQNLENRGQSYSRNIGVERSNSGYIVFGDDDDKSLPNRSKLHLQQFENGSDIGYVSSIKLYENGYFTEARNIKLTSITIDPLNLSRMLILGEIFLEGQVFVPSCALAVRKSAFLDVGGFDEKLRRLEDVDLAIRFARNNYLFEWDAEIGLERYHSDGPDKGGAVDPFFEISLINKYADYLSRDELRRTILAAKVRSAYFSHRYLKMLGVLFLHRGSFLLIRSKFFAFTRRLIHDFKKF
jgi:glycosyltransferase involved in cell wall biosynthesis